MTSCSFCCLRGAAPETLNYLNICHDSSLSLKAARYVSTLYLTASPLNATPLQEPRKHELESTQFAPGETAILLLAVTLSCLTGSELMVWLLLSERKLWAWKLAR